MRRNYYDNILRRHERLRNGAESARAIRLTNSPEGRSGTAREASSADSGAGGMQPPAGVQPAAPNAHPAPRDGAARLAFRDGEAPGTLEILSFDARGECTVHRISGLALMNLNVKCAEAIRRGALS